MQALPLFSPARVLCLFLLTMAFQAATPSPALTAFTQLTPGLANTDYSDSDWVDYDKDGDLDLALMGRTDNTTRSFLLYNNDGGAFSPVATGVTGLAFGGMDWGDYDNDGDLDLAISGSAWVAGNPVAQSFIYRNDGGGVFTDIGANIPQVDFSDLAWGDYDNDGDLDLALIGETDSSEKVAAVLRNDAGTFSDSGISLIPMTSGSLAWGDHDNDGDLDLIAGGSTASGHKCILYQNRNGTLVASGFELDSHGSDRVCWGDYDNDGDLDLVLAYIFDDHTYIYRNDGGTFSDSGIVLDSTGCDHIAFGDYDNDGDLDLLLTGAWVSANSTSLYRNDGALFTKVDVGFTQLDKSTASWGDMDGDGDLDLILAGAITTSNFATYIYRNDGGWGGSGVNTPPSPPARVYSRATYGGVRVFWEPGSDAETPAAGLSYNIMAGTSQGGVEITSPPADPGTGRLLIPADGVRKQRGGISSRDTPPATPCSSRCRRWMPAWPVRSS